MSGSTWRAWSLVGAVALAGCGGGRLKTCTADAECGAGAHCVQQVCAIDQPGACGTTFCTAAQRCNAKLECVADLPPVLNLTAPIADAGVSTATVEVSGTATDDAAPPTVEVSTDGTTWAPVTLAAGGAFTTQVPLPSLDGQSLSLTVRARDSKANEVRETRSLRVDNVAPVCAFTTPAAGAELAGPSVAVAMTASDGSGLVNPRLSLDSAATFAAPLGAGGSYTFAWTPAAENGIAHELVFRVDDANGKTCEARRTVTIDNVIPTIAFASPDAGALLGPAFFASGRFVGTAGDGTQALKSVTLDFGDGQGARAVTVQDGGWSLAVPAVATDDYQAHAVKVVATDLANNTATATLPVFADVVAPALAITAPAANAKFNAASFSGTDDVTLAWTVTDGDPTAPTVALQTADGGTLTPPKVTTSPADNPTTYQPTLVATDRAGNSRTASVTFSVDRVAPTVTATAPANGTRMFVGATSIDFSEPMNTAPALVLTPALTGSWTTPTHFEISGLAKDSVYSVAQAAVADLYGNPAALGSSRNFHTETWVPTPGMTLATGYGAVTEAVADPEGGLNFLADVDGGTAWVQLRPSTGAPEEVTRVLAPYEANARNLAAGRSIQPSLASNRVAGMTFDQSGTHFVAFRVDAGMGVMSGEAFIPTPAFAGEGSSLGDFGFIDGFNYKRAGRADLYLGMLATSLKYSAKHWEIARPNGTNGASSETFGCYFSFGNQCDLSALKTTVNAAGSTETQLAVSNSCSIHYVSDASLGHHLVSKWQPNCPAAAPCVSDSTTPATILTDVVADPANDGIFFGVAFALGVWNFAQLSVDSSCAGTWVILGNGTALPSLIGTPRLVVIRGSPGLVYADTNGNVKFAGP